MIKINLHSLLYILLLFCILSGPRNLFAESKKAAPKQGTGIRIIPRTIDIRDDSVRIDVEIIVAGIRIPGEQSLSLIPELSSGSKRVILPSVILSGRQRARYDRREEAVAPNVKQIKPYHTWVGVRAEEKYNLRYRVAIPYASWMDHAALSLKQVSRSCCDELLLSDDVLTNDIALTSPCAKQEIEQIRPVALLPETAEVPPITVITPAPVPIKKTEVDPLHTSRLSEAEQRVVLSLYIDYPRGGSQVDPYYGRNRGELQKVDSVINSLLSDCSVMIREIRITGYASPDGAYYDNEALAKARSLGFKSYLSKSYGLQDYPFRTAWVAEDWEGLRKLLKGKPYEKVALGIIDRYGIFEGRERILMETDGGVIYRDMLHELFPLLRRMEIIITYKNTLPE